MAFFDLNCPVDFGPIFSTVMDKGVTDAYRTSYLFPIDGLLADVRIQQVRASVSRQSFTQHIGRRKRKTLLDLRGNLPTTVTITPGKVHDVNILDQLPIEPGAIYVMNRGYVDFARLCKIVLASAFYLIRAKNNFDLPALTIAKFYQHSWQIELSSNGSNNTCASKRSMEPQRPR